MHIIAVGSFHPKSSFTRNSGLVLHILAKEQEYKYIRLAFVFCILNLILSTEKGVKSTDGTLLY